MCQVAAESLPTLHKIQLMGAKLKRSTDMSDAMRVDNYRNLAAKAQSAGDIPQCGGARSCWLAHKPEEIEELRATDVVNSYCTSLLDTKLYKHHESRSSGWQGPALIRRSWDSLGRPGVHHLAL